MTARNLREHFRLHMYGLELDFVLWGLLLPDLKGKPFTHEIQSFLVQLFAYGLATNHAGSGRKTPF